MHVSEEKYADEFDDHSNNIQIPSSPERVYSVNDTQILLKLFAIYIARHKHTLHRLPSLGSDDGKLHFMQAVLETYSSMQEKVIADTDEDSGSDVDDNEMIDFFYNINFQILSLTYLENRDALLLIDVNLSTEDISLNHYRLITMLRKIQQSLGDDGATDEFIIDSTLDLLAVPYFIAAFKQFLTLLKSITPRHTLRANFS